MTNLMADLGQSFFMVICPKICPNLNIFGITELLDSFCWNKSGALAGSVDHLGNRNDFYLVSRWVFAKTLMFTMTLGEFMVVSDNP